MLEGIVIQHLIQRSLQPYAADAKRLSQKERLAVVEDLYKNGLFVLKGSVYALAQVLAYQNRRLTVT